MNDVIYRKEAIDALTTECSWTIYDEHGQLTPNGEEILGTLKKIPSARKKGHWVEVSGYATPGGDPVWACSECRKGLHTYGIEHGSYGSDIADRQWVSCPNCGADMRGEEDR